MRRQVLAEVEKLTTLNKATEIILTIYYKKLAKHDVDYNARCLYYNII